MSGGNANREVSDRCVRVMMQRALRLCPVSYSDLSSFQDALFFLKDFFTSLSTEVELLLTPDPEGTQHIQSEGSAVSTEVLT